MKTRLPILAISLVALGSPALAHEDHAPALEEIVVYGRAVPLIGDARSASEGLVAFDDLRLPPLLRTGELVESVPGMVATQHSGTGKANQYFLRGFNLDHGTDFAATLDGVPLNLRTHGHGQGYLDMNFIIPELVETTWYRKGPYSLAVGDFSSAGSVDFRYADRLDQNLIELEGGSHGFHRGLIAGSLKTGRGDLTTAVDVTGYDGPWKKDENSTQFKGYLGFVSRLGEIPVRIELHGFDSDWDATDQIPERAVRSGLISRLGHLDGDAGGHSDRYQFSTALDFPGWQLTGYAVHSNLTLHSNFTYLLDNPVDGDEFTQRDGRNIYGATAAGTFGLGAGEDSPGLEWGLELRHDQIDRLALTPSTARQPTGQVRDDRVDESSLAGHAGIRWPITRYLDARFGARIDHYRWNVDAIERANSGRGHETQISPKATLAFRPATSLELYLNYGRGMHSNDVRGAELRVDPASGDPAEPLEVLVPSEGAEIGLRYQPDKSMNVTLALFRLELDSELVFVGDAGGTETRSGSVRQGIELAGFWQVTDWLSAHGSYGWTQSRHPDEPVGFRHVPGAIRSAASGGFNARWDNGLAASLRLRYLGPAPLTEDNRVRSRSSMMVNAGMAWRRGAFEYRIDAFNLTDSRDYDIAYYYTSRLAGEPDEGVDDIHFHPLEPRSIRAAVRVLF